jgi:hypothetical protein
VPLETPGILVAQRPFERALGVEAMRVDGEARVLAREALVLRGKPELLAHYVEQVARIAAIEDGEAGIQAEVVRVLAQQSIGDGMKGPGPAKFFRMSARALA